MRTGIENILKNTPLPVAGLAFGLTALGGLFAELGQGFWAMPLFGMLGFAMLLIALLKIYYFPQVAKANLNHPIQAAVVPVIPFTIMLDASYLSSSYPTLALGLWLISCVVTLVYVSWFVWRYLLHFQLKNVFAAFFIPFVGFCVPVMTSHHLAEHYPMLETWRYALFNFSAAAFIVMFGLISLRYWKLPVDELPAKPVFAIYTAPLAMLIVGYIRLPLAHSTIYLSLALLLSQALFFIVLNQVPHFLKNGFFPSYAALTFPFIISANSLWESLSLFGNSAFLTALAWLESLFAIIMTLFVFYKYLKFLQKTAKGV